MCGCGANSINHYDQSWVSGFRGKVDFFLLLRRKFEFVFSVIFYGIETPKVKSLLQMIAQRKLYDLDFELTIIINSSVNLVPKEIEKYVLFLEIPYPSENEIKDIITDHVKTNGYDAFDEKARRFHCRNARLRKVALRKGDGCAI